MLTKIAKLVSGNKPRSAEVLVRDCGTALEALLELKQRAPLSATSDSSSGVSSEGGVTSSDGGGAGGGGAAGGAVAGAAISASEERRRKLLAERRQELQKCLAEMKTILTGNWMKVKDAKKAKQPVDEEISKLEEQLIDENQHIIIQLTSHLRHLPFEARKDLAHIVAFLTLRREKRGANGMKGDSKFVKYLKQNTSIIITLKNNIDVEGCELNSLEMLKAMAQRKTLASFMLCDGTKVYLAFLQRYCVSEKFEVCTESFEFLRILLTHNSSVKELAAEFLSNQSNYDEFFSAYKALLIHPKYIVRRMALELLGKLLLDRKYFNVMMQYIGDRVNLALIMSMLAEKNEQIQVEAFHVFKVFVANPRKNELIIRVLQGNAHKLIPFLEGMRDQRDDSSFEDEKELLVKELTKLSLAREEAEEAAKEKREREKRSSQKIEGGGGEDGEGGGGAGKTSQQELAAPKKTDTRVDDGEESGKDGGRGKGKDI